MADARPVFADLCLSVDRAFCSGLRTVTLALLALLLAACAPRHFHSPPTLAESCRDRLQQLDHQLEEAGLQDVGAYRIPGYPHLRTTRFWSSFRNELGSEERRRTWVEALRTEDAQARELELARMGEAGIPWAPVVEDCGSRLLAETLNDTQGFGQLLELAKVPSEYSMLARLFGFYPIAVPFLRMGIAGYQSDVLDMFSMPLPEDELMTWAPQGQSGSPEWKSGRNALGIPQLTDTDWQALFRRHAPVWEVGVKSIDDQPGIVRWQGHGLVVSGEEVATYVRPALARFNGRILVQLVYSLWFPRRTATGQIDPYAGEYDAVIWRVTLDETGLPLVYDSIHGCGCYHMVFPVQPLRARPQADFWQESVLFPQAVVPQGPVRLRLSAGEHFLQRVLPADSIEATGHYLLLPASGLLNLPTPEGSRSLYDERGLLPGSERLERFWLWPSGVVSPGAMRQYGRHATAFVGERHFDDPHLLDQWFYPQESGFQ